MAAGGYRIRRVPAIVIDAKLAEDVMGRGIDEMTLSDAISKPGRRARRRRRRRGVAPFGPVDNKYYGINIFRTDATSALFNNKPEAFTWG